MRWASWATCGEGEVESLRGRERRGVARLGVELFGFEEDGAERLERFRALPDST